MHCAKFDWNWPEVKNGKSLRRQIDIWTNRQMTNDSWIELELTLDFSSLELSVCFIWSINHFIKETFLLSLEVHSVQWRTQVFQTRGRGLGIWGLLWRPFTHCAGLGSAFGWLMGGGVNVTAAYETSMQYHKLITVYIYNSVPTATAVNPCNIFV